MKLSKRSSCARRDRPSPPRCCCPPVAAATTSGGDGGRRRQRWRHLQHLHRRAAEPAGPGQHHRERGRPGRRRPLDRPGRVRRGQRGRVHRRRRVDRVRGQHHLDGHAQGRLDLPRRHPGERAVLRRRVELHRATARTPRVVPYFFAQHRGYDDLQGPSDDAGELTGPRRDRDERPRGRRRPDLHRHADRAVRAVPGRPSATTPSTRCPRSSSRTPRPSASSPSATARSRPTRSSSRARASP